MGGAWTKVGLTGAAIVALAALAVVYFRSDRDQAAPAAAAVQPVPVIATTVQQHDVPIILTGLGTVTRATHCSRTLRVT
jgi:multidrug efflux system membrane fusion protein